jgi:pyruvate/2-oxoglutarate dehydrogenase complex dihydrolipoamide dehydrogenase (E3) component
MAGAQITLDDGTAIVADTVLVAIGSVLNTGWLGPMAGPAGLICDAAGQVDGHDGVFAIGDIAGQPPAPRSRSTRGPTSSAC